MGIVVVDARDSEPYRVRCRGTVLTDRWYVNLSWLESSPPRMLIHPSTTIHTCNASLHFQMILCESFFTILNI